MNAGDLVVYQNKFGYIRSVWEKSGYEYVELGYIENNNYKTLVTVSSAVQSAENYIRMALAAGVVMCLRCNGRGKITPIENPTYICNSCNGKGYIIEE